MSEELKHTWYMGGNGYNNGWCGGGYPVVYNKDNNCGWAVGLLAVGAAVLGGALFLKRDDGAERYLSAKAQGATEAAIGCCNAGISRLEGQFSQLFQNQLNAAQSAAATLGVVNTLQANQAKTDAGLASNSVQLGILRDLINNLPEGTTVAP